MFRFRFIFTYKKLQLYLVFFSCHFLSLLSPGTQCFHGTTKSYTLSLHKTKPSRFRAYNYFVVLLKNLLQQHNGKKSAHIWQQKEKCGVPSQWRQRPSRPCQCFVGHFTDCWCSVTPRVRSSLCGTPCFSVCVVSFPCYCTTCQHGTKTSVNDSQ